MTPQAAEFLAKAQHLLAETDIMLDVGLNNRQHDAVSLDEIERIVIGESP